MSSCDRFWHLDLARNEGEGLYEMEIGSMQCIFCVLLVAQPNELRVVISGHVGAKPLPPGVSKNCFFQVQLGFRVERRYALDHHSACHHIQQLGALRKANESSDRS